MHPQLLLLDRRGVRRRRRRLATLQTPPLATAAFLLLVAAAFGVTWELAVARPAEERPATDSCSSLDLPLRHTEVVVHVSGCIAAVDVEQTFHNPYGRSIEAQYVFPLPHRAAVTDMEMRIGERVVRSHIWTREEARAIYDTARKEGRAAALLDQERPNIFTQQVANIQPGHDIRVRLRYVEDLIYEEGAYELVFPTVVGPRFIPGSPVPASRVEPAASRTPGGADQAVSPSQQGPAGSGWAPDTDRVPDASRITPPVVRPIQRAGHDVMIRVELDAGVPLQDVQCASHAVDIVRPAPGRATVRLRLADRVPNKDFVLRYRVAGDAPQIGLLTHRDTDQADGPGYLLLHVAGPSQMSGRDARPKEIIFLLDTSGSMSGEPLNRSRAAMRWALQHLDPDDTFQIIRFSDRFSSFAPAPVQATPDAIERGLAYVGQLEGSGGTQMLEGLRAALGTPHQEGHLRIVCMLTDGYIGNEAEIIAEVRLRLGPARLFSFGIGSSVNRYLLDALAEEGRGTVDYVPLDADTRPLVERFYGRIARAALTDLEVDYGGLDVDGLQPATLPDLFAGQTLALSGRYHGSGTGEVVVRGRLGRQRFERRLRVVLPERQAEHPELGTLWARRRIDTLMSRMLLQEQEPLVQEVTRLALAFRLASRYTSFVATDNQVVSQSGEPMLVPQAVEMPLGVSYEGVFGRGSGTLQGAMMRTSSAGVLSLPVESVTEAVALNAGSVVAGAQLHVRSGRADTKSSDVTHVTTDKEANSSPARVTANRKAQSLTVAGDPECAIPSPLAVTTSIEATMVAEPSRILLGERARFRIQVRNASQKEVQVPETLLWTDLTFEVRLNGGPARPSTCFEHRTARTVTLLPGESREYVLQLAEAPAAALLGNTGKFEIQLLQFCGGSLAGQPARCEIRIE